MTTITIIGSTGLVGRHTLAALMPLIANKNVQVLLADRNQTDPDWMAEQVTTNYFDFEDRTTWDSILSRTDTLFLLRPPQLTDMEGIFAPFINAAKSAKVAHIIFLSVQGAPDVSFIPHHKIEQLIKDSGIAYTFLRPAYFMQNFEGNLRHRLVRDNQIYLPAGNTPITLIDVVDLGRVAAKILTMPERFLNIGLDLTGPESLTFGQMATTITEATGVKITYTNAWLIPFIVSNASQHVAWGLNMVMALLHFAPRFRPLAPVTDHVCKITSQQPATFAQYAERALLPMLRKTNNPIPVSSS